jgi:putative transposase
MTRGFPTFQVGKLPLTNETCSGARLVPFYDRFIVELLYTVQFHAFPYNNNIPPRAMGIDLGLTNLVTTSDGFIVKGGIAKTINQWYNKQLAHYRSRALICNQQNSTRRIERLHRLRANQLHDLFHQISRKVINYCLVQNIDTVVIGYNAHWKQRCNLGYRTNQSFVQIPFLEFIQMLEYKAKLVGISVIRVNEAYTSQKCSKCKYISKKNRKSRGWFCCQSCGMQVNADYNAALNILQRGCPDSQVVPPINFASPRVGLPDSGCVTHPVQNSYIRVV